MLTTFASFLKKSYPNHSVAEKEIKLQKMIGVNIAAWR